MNPPAPALLPTAPGERLLQLDVLRGLALLGVLLVNITEFSGSELALEGKLAFPLGWGGTLPGYLRQVLLESKAAALLAMLFGAGLAMQSEKLAQRGRAYLPFALRRAGALALLGIAHSVLLWNVDILLDYAVISLLVAPFLRLRDARILWAIPILLVASLLLAVPFARAPELGLSFQSALREYGQGSWLDALKFRVWELMHVMGPMRIANRLPVLTPFFVLGAYFWRKGLFSGSEQHWSTLRRICVISLVLGLLANLLPQNSFRAWVELHVALRPVRILIKVIVFLGGPWLCVGYATGLLLLLRSPVWRRVLSVFAPLGRMTLTQYLLQSVVCTWVFNGYGLGLYGKVSVNACIWGALAFYALQVWTSGQWLARFRIGPVEWLWRRMIYGAREVGPAKA